MIENVVLRGVHDNKVYGSQTALCKCVLQYLGPSNTYPGESTQMSTNPQLRTWGVNGEQTLTCRYKELQSSTRYYMFTRQLPRVKNIKLAARVPVKGDSQNGPDPEGQI